MAIFAEVAFVDDACAPSPQSFCDCELLPSGEGFGALKGHGYNHFVVAIGNNRVRERCYLHAIEQGLEAATLIHPSAVVSGSVRIGSGTVVMPRVVINPDAVIGNNCILNTGAIVEHDCRIGDHVHLAPGVILGGNVQVEAHCFLGIGTIVLPGATVGAEAIVGAGSVVLDSAPPGATSVGVPAKVLSKSQRH